ncbi:MAG TPA: YegS/Rv2252/BmrU family lipid kinase [Propionibacteriaceae bacterium]|nr:YegS/Rv2252/BmrU family lipid kinase [Propionibacteriaceae bacterium]
MSRATRTVTLVVNPSSGRGRALELLPQVAGRLRDAGLTTEILLSRHFDEAAEMTQAAASSSVDVLAVMGGDGMMHLGLNACASARSSGNERLTLGVIPAGTGNDFARGLGLDPGDPVAAAEVVGAGFRRHLDLARVNGRYVGAVVAAGFDALVNQRANAMPWPRGALRYPLAALAELRVFAPLSYRLTVDGTVRDLEAMLVAVGNTSTYGGGMRICPDAAADDGLLDVTIVHPVSRAKLVQLLPRMYSGSFVRDRCVEQLRAREVTVTGPGLVGFGDGELLGAAPLTVSSEAQALSVFAVAAR